MAKTLIETGGNTLQLRFDGLQAGGGVMPLEDFIVSLRGWNGFLHLAANVCIQQEWTLDSLPSDMQPRMTISSPKRGSVVADITLNWDAIVTGLVLTGLIGGVKDLRKLFWLFVKHLYHKYIDGKKTNKTLWEVAESFKTLDPKIKKPKSMAEMVELVKLLDSSLKDASNPVEKSAEILYVETSDGKAFKLAIDRQEKRRIHEGFYYDKDSDKSVFKAKVVLTELNVLTGHTYVNVVESNNREFTGAKVSCKIKDGSHKAKENIFSESLHKQVSIDVFVNSLHNPTTGIVKEWHLRKERPAIDIGGMFSDLGNGGED